MAGPNDLMYVQDTRPMKNLDSIFTQTWDQRMQEFPHTRSHKDAILFNSKELEKQLDLYVIRVTLEDGDDNMRDAFTDHGGQCECTPYKRSIEQMTNEEGRWMRTWYDMLEIAKTYSVPEDEILDMWKSVNCSKHDLKELLE